MNNNNYELVKEFQSGDGDLFHISYCFLAVMVEDNGKIFDIGEKSLISEYLGGTTFGSAFNDWHNIFAPKGAVVIFREYGSQRGSESWDKFQIWSGSEAPVELLEFAQLLKEEYEEEEYEEEEYEEYKKNKIKEEYLKIKIKKFNRNKQLFMLN